METAEIIQQQESMKFREGIMRGANEKHRGALTELVACVWLLREGYEVFRNISAHGTADIMACKDGKDPSDRREVRKGHLA